VDYAQNTLLVLGLKPPGTLNTGRDPAAAVDGLKTYSVLLGFDQILAAGLPALKFYL
jgi:hypothetical protein